MALKGTIKDFGLADIFQLIALQKKTGVLALESKGNPVNISFHEGMIISADVLNRWEGDRLGEVLVKAGKISREQLDRALEINKGSGHRLGYILLKEDLINKDELSAALQHQMKSLVFRLFHWKEGRYKFDAKDTPSSDNLHSPIDTEYILMEGLRILDEWPAIEHRIPSFDTVLHQVQDKVDEEDSEITLSENDKRILNLVDGKSDISMIIASSGMDEIEACNILIKLMDTNLIEKPSRQETTARVSVAKALPELFSTINLKWFKAVIIEFIIVLFILIEGIGLLSGIKTPVREFLTFNRAEALRNSVRRYYLNRGEYPATLKMLVTEGYIKNSDVLDLWGRPFIYRKNTSSYEIYSSGPDRIEGNSDDIK